MASAICPQSWKSNSASSPGTKAIKVLKFASSLSDNNGGASKQGVEFSCSQALLASGPYSQAVFSCHGARIWKDLSSTPDNNKDFPTTVPSAPGGNLTEGH